MSPQLRMKQEEKSFTDSDCDNSNFIENCLEKIEFLDKSSELESKCSLNFSQNSELMWKKKYKMDKRLLKLPTLRDQTLDFVVKRNENISDHYEFGKKLGKGNFGIVLQAKHKKTE